VDLGGTNVRAAAYQENGQPAGQKFSNPSRAQEGTDAIIAAISGTIKQAVEAAESKPDSIGMAIPGHIDDDKGEVVWAPNFGGTIDGVFKNWVNMPLKKILEPLVGLPIRMGNDANLAALGEYKFGSGKDAASCLVLLTVGTGIGSGVIMRPQAVFGKAEGPLMLLGGNKGGAEMGHTIIQHGGLDCHAGTYGSLEGYCQRDSIVNRAVHRLQRGRESIIGELVDGDFSKITPLTLSQAAAKGDELAIEVWAEVGTYLGVGIGNAINIFAPEVVAIGGQIAKVGEFLLGPARKAARNIAIPSLFEGVTISAAEQIDDAGLLGGAALALQASL
jgi:glucokinase